SIVPWTEIMTTGRDGCCFLISSRRSSPSSREPCSQMSRNTKRGTRLAMAARALSASWAVRVSCPSSLKMPATSSRMSSSSSTIRMSDAIFNLPPTGSTCAVLLDRGQDDADHGPPSSMELGRSVMQFQPTAMVLYNLPHDREPETRPLLAGGHVGLQQT